MQQTCSIAIQAWLLGQYSFYEGSLYKPADAKGVTGADKGWLTEVLQELRLQSGKLKLEKNEATPRRVPMITPIAKIISAIPASELGERVEKELRDGHSICEEPSNWNFALIDDFRRSSNRC